MCAFQEISMSKWSRISFKQKLWLKKISLISEFHSTICSICWLDLIGFNVVTIWNNFIYIFSLSHLETARQHWSHHRVIQFGSAIMLHPRFYWSQNFFYRQKKIQFCQMKSKKKLGFIFLGILVIKFNFLVNCKSFYSI